MSRQHSIDSLKLSIGPGPKHYPDVLFSSAEVGLVLKIDNFDHAVPEGPHKLAAVTTQDLIDGVEIRKVQEGNLGDMKMFLNCGIVSGLFHEPPRTRSRMPPGPHNNS